jgi:hypothetical protein
MRITYSLRFAAALSFHISFQECVLMKALRSSIAGILLGFLALICGQAPARAATPQAAGPQASGTPLEGSGSYITIPGPLAFFQRIAAISRKAEPDEVLPFLARNVVVDGYQRAQDKDRKPTEFLKLLDAYLDQARELEAAANTQGHIHVSGCANVAPLLQVLGYRLRGTCGKDAEVETADPERAFLTVDSGFPLVELEEDLQQSKPFDYLFGTSQVPVLFSPRDWGWTDKNLVDELTADPLLARLYWAFSRLDTVAPFAGPQSAGSTRSRSRFLRRKFGHPRRQGAGAGRRGRGASLEGLGGSKPRQPRGIPAEAVAEG